MDKSWMKLPMGTNEYRAGVEAFLDLAFGRASVNGNIQCPCKRCVNSKWQTRENCRLHLIRTGFLPGYTHWIMHGERTSHQNPTGRVSTRNLNMGHNEGGSANLNMGHNMGSGLGELLSDVFSDNSEFVQDEHVEDMEGEPVELPQPMHMDFESTETNEHVIEIEGEAGEPLDHQNNVNPKFVFKTLEYYKKELFPGCPVSKLSALLQLLHLKCLKGLDAECFEMFLQFLITLFPGIDIPETYYDCKRLIKDLGLGYEKIHACPNNCMLFWKESANEEFCRVCGSSRWQPDENTQTDHTKKKRIPAKVLRYFPLIPRLQRLFMSTKTAEDMRWHAEKRVNDGKLRHPADGEAWKAFDTRYQDFSKEARNVRLGLSTDGFNPYGTLSSQYTNWPVVLIPYNLPPWINMKQHSLIISLIIPGPKSPGTDIDVFLKPLIEDLKQLWAGVETYDASKQESFKMRGSLLWTISDFPALSMLSGWAVKGYKACPNCGPETCALRLPKSHTTCYMGHRRWLPKDDKFRFNKREFDGNEEHREPPPPVTGTMVLDQTKNLNVVLGKPRKDMEKKKKRNRSGGWKKRSIFFELPYWEHNLLRHNLDVMHQEKNVGEVLVPTLLDADKSRDDVSARDDLKELNIKRNLWLKTDKNGKVWKPSSLFTMTRKEREILCKVIKEVRTPDGYASNLSRCVNMENLTLTGLKCHDYHVLLQQILPLALRSCYPSSQVMEIVVEISRFFRYLCSKTLDVAELDKAQERIVLVLCKLERYSLPKFFTIMVHLTVHLVEEAKLGGPVHQRWMYPIERWLGYLKSLTRNKARPEGSIAEGYIADECLTFCSRYLDGIKTKFNTPGRNRSLSEVVQGTFFYDSGGIIHGKDDVVELDERSLTQAHRYVLKHCDDILPYKDEFINTMRQRDGHLSGVEIEKRVTLQFSDWFRSKVMDSPRATVSDKVKALARGPNRMARQFSAYTINGYKFHTKDRAMNKKTQNSGVVVNAFTEGETSYYGKINSMIELNYYGDLKVVLFKCDWIDMRQNKGIKTDRFGFTSVNFSSLVHTGARIEHEPFVFSSQVDQVFYVTNSINPEWCWPVITKPRDYFEMDKELTAHADLPTNNPSFPVEEQTCMVRRDVDAEEVIITTEKRKKTQ